MLVIGFLILLCIEGNFCIYKQPLLCTNFTVTSVFLLSVLSYVVGLLFHKLWEYLIRVMIACCKHGKKLGLIGKEISGIFLSFERNNLTLIKNAKTDASLQPMPLTSENDEEVLKCDYYKAYYGLLRNNMLGNIPILEAQEAFLRNLLPVFIALTVRCHCLLKSILYIGGCCYIVMSVSLTILLLLAHYSIQKKIYYLVWEGYIYVKKSPEEL